MKTAKLRVVISRLGLLRRRRQNDADSWRSSWFFTPEFLASWIASLEFEQTLFISSSFVAPPEFNVVEEHFSCSRDAELIGRQAKPRFAECSEQVRPRWRSKLANAKERLRTAGRPKRGGTSHQSVSRASLRYPQCEAVVGAHLFATDLTARQHTDNKPRSDSNKHHVYLSLKTILVLAVIIDMISSPVT